MDMENLVKKYIDDDIPLEILLNLILVYHGARFATLIEYTNFSTYYKKDEFYLFLLDVVGNINKLGGPVLCIYLESLMEYPRYLIFQYQNYSFVSNTLQMPADWHYKIGLLLEMTKPGGEFANEKIVRVGCRIIVEKFPGINLFAEMVPIVNVYQDFLLIKDSLKKRLEKYNNVLTKYNFPCKIELSG